MNKIVVSTKAFNVNTNTATHFPAIVDEAYAIRYDGDDPKAELLDRHARRAMLHLLEDMAAKQEECAKRNRAEAEAFK